MEARDGVPQSSQDCGALTAAVACAVARAAGRARSTELERDIAQVGERLAGPVRLAVGGRLKAGKSTLLNALVGRRVAATAAGECTKVVAWYRYSDRDRIEVHGRDGSVRVVHPQRDGSIPDDLGAPAEAIDHLDVSVTLRSRLERVTLIDTPGLFSLNDQYSEGTRRAMGLEGDAESSRGVSQSDALVYLMPHPGDSDMQFLRELHGLYPGSNLSAATAVGVLSRIDLFRRPGRDDPWVDARRLAERYARTFRLTLRTVIPVAGLLAETALGGTFTEADAADVVELARHPDRERLLISVDAFTSARLPGTEHIDRGRLRGMLDVYGFAVCIGLVDEGATGAIDLLRGLRTASGIDALGEVVDADFSQRADLWRASWALDELERLSYRAGEDDAATADDLRADIETIRLRPDFHPVGEMRVLGDLEAGRLTLPPERERELLALAHHMAPAPRLGLGEDATRGELHEAAAGLRHTWRELENDDRTGSADRAAARVARRSFDLLVAQLEMAEAAPGTSPGGDASNVQHDDPDVSATADLEDDERIAGAR